MRTLIRSYPRRSDILINIVHTTNYNFSALRTKMASLIKNDLNGQSDGHANGDEDGYPRKPLKQSGLLNEKCAFDDLTPVIGREFLNVNVVNDLLNSPEADALLKDLAITSGFTPVMASVSTKVPSIDTVQLVNVESSSFAPRQTLPTTCKRNWSSVWASCLGSPALPHYMCTPSSTVLMSSDMTIKSVLSAR